MRKVEKEILEKEKRNYMKNISTLAVKVGAVSLIATALLSSIAMAAVPCPTNATCTEETPSTPVTTKADFLAVLNIGLNWVFTIFVLLAVLFVILAAIDFLTNGGNAEKLSEARQKLIWAAVAIIVALVARGLPKVVQSILGGTP